MQITFIAQSGFILKDSNLSIGIDLWLSNPLNPKNLNDIAKMDYLFLTHDHNDHGKNDMIQIAKRDSSKFICNAGTAATIENPTFEVFGGSIGGKYSVGDLNVINTHAYHGSQSGDPMGFVIQMLGKTIYHLGDTGFYSEMADYATMYPVDILFIPIGGFYTMGPTEASYAVSRIKPKVCIPMHYNTSERIKQDPTIFKQLVEDFGLQTQVVILNPGESYNF